MSEDRNKTLIEGQIFAGRYRLGKVLGRGGMGTVHAAIDTRIDKPVAIKVLNKDLQNRPEILARFESEAKASAAIRHKNVVDVTDFGSDGGRFYICYEVLHGRELAASLKNGEPLSVEVAIHITLAICAGMAAAHAKGIIHRDLKPENVFLCDEGDGAVGVKILDFGIAKIAEDNRSLTKTGVIFGTPHYMSPEQLLGRKDVDPRSDVYSIGVMLYEMLTGKLPYDEASEASQWIVINEGERQKLDDGDLESILAEALRCSREQRIQSATAFADALREYARRRSLLPQTPVFLTGMAKPVDAMQTEILEFGVKSVETHVPPTNQETQLGPVTNGVGTIRVRGFPIGKLSLAATGIVLMIVAILIGLRPRTQSLRPTPARRAVDAGSVVVAVDAGVDPRPAAPVIIPPPRAVDAGSVVVAVDAGVDPAPTPIRRRYHHVRSLPTPVPCQRICRQTDEGPECHWGPHGCRR